MKHLIRISVLSLAILLSACSTKNLAFRASFSKTIAPDMHAQMSKAITNVIQRRVESMQSTFKNLETTQTTEGIDIAFTVTGKAAGEITNQLVTPFSLRIMRSAKTGEKPDILIEDVGGFMDLGVNQKDVFWVTSGADDLGKGWVQIVFTPEGGKKVKKAMASTKGLQIGLMVRDQLVSTFQSQGVGRENIYISGVPSAELAGVFADDVNVGVHVTFVPKQ